MARESEMWSNDYEEIEKNIDTDELINYEVTEHELVPTDYGTHFTTNEVKLILIYLCYKFEV